MMLVLALLALLAFGLQLHAVSPYLLYPDSYQNLIVAQNLTTIHQVAGPLGPGGLPYPPNFDWTRPGFAALVALAHALGASWTLAPHIIAIAAGTAAIPAAYGAVITIWRSRLAALAAAALLALSFGHTVWGGFGLTEPLAVLSLLLAITLVWRRREHPPTPAALPDLIAGAVWALAALIRYEYALLLLPAILIATRSRFSWVRTLNLLAGWITVLSLGLLAAHPLQVAGLGSLAATATAFLPIIAALAILATLALALRRHFAGRHIANLLIGLLLIATLLTVIRAHTYFTPDLLTSLIALAGIIIALRRPGSKTPILYALANIVLLSLIYLKVNPAMARYGTHLLPFLLIPAGLALATTLHYLPALRPRFRTAAALGLAVLALLQTTLAYQGLRAVPGNPWFQPGYEAVSAQKLTTLPGLPPGAVLIVSLPEPYYFFTRHITQSIAQDPPYLYADLPDTQAVLIVQDAPMRRLFPKFSAALDARLQPYLIHQYAVPGPFRYQRLIDPQPGPVTIYQTTYGQLKTLLKDEILTKTQ